MSFMELATLHGLLNLVAPSRKVLCCSERYSLPMWPHIGRQSLSPILLLSWIFNSVTLQLGQLKHSDSYLRGRQQLFIGVLFVHWTTMWVKVELLEMVPSSEGCRAQGNTPDFMLEWFIVHLSDDTVWSLPVMAIQLVHHS